jgi:cytochrome c553
MRKTAGVLVAAFVCALSIGADAQLGKLREPGWAFQIIDPKLPESQESEGTLTVPGSTQKYTQKDVENLAAPPDWFPEENAPKPDIIVRGSGAALACGACHLMSGLGHPESADLAGLPAAYIVRQLQEFKSGARKDISRMNGISEALTDEQMKQAADWFAGLEPVAWNKVVEAEMVPKTYVGAGRMRFVHPDGGMEPIGNRIITLPQDPKRARIRDPKSGFIAYVPPGSIKRGEDLVKTGGGGRTIACAACHGDSYQGADEVPRLAGVHSIYIARQLYLFKNGERAGDNAALMLGPVANLTDEDIVAISAYLGSLEP